MLAALMTAQTMAGTAEPASMPDFLVRDRKRQIAGPVLRSRHHFANPYRSVIRHTANGAFGIPITSSGMTPSLDAH
jgi:hypothetical protein